MTAIFFNLFVNATFSLLMGLAIVAACMMLFRVEDGRWKLFLWFLPFGKVLYDFAQGVPMSSVLFTPWDPLNAPPGSQSFTLSLGMNDFGPGLKAIFSLRDAFGFFHGVSAGDYLVFWIAHHWGLTWPRLILQVALAVTVVLLLRRLFSVLSFERKRRRDRAVATTLREIRLRWRKVDVYASPGFEGSPFTGGFWRPYICVPQTTLAQLSSEELDAVIAHELGHVRQWDLLGTLFVQVTGDLFWFVPGYRWLGRKIDRLREVIADQVAVKAGTDPVLLASVLVKLKELALQETPMPLYSAFVRERSLLKYRVQSLIGTLSEKQPRWFWRKKWLRGLVCFWVAGMVLNSNLAGNHTGLMQAPSTWLKTVLELLHSPPSQPE